MIRPTVSSPPARRSATRVRGSAASVARLSRGGFGDNLTTGDENYNKDVWAGAARSNSAAMASRCSIRMSGDYTKDKADPRGGHRLIPGLVSGAPVLNNVFDTAAASTIRSRRSRPMAVAMNVTAELTDTLTLRSISAWRKDKSTTPIDFDALPAVDVDVPGMSISMSR